MCKDLGGGGGDYYVRNRIMFSAEGAGAGRSGHRAPAGGSGGSRHSGQPSGGVRFQMPGLRPHAGKKSSCDKKELILKYVDIVKLNS